jgi:hypothetical protein
MFKAISTQCHYISCLLHFLIAQVKYLDSLQLNGIEISEEGTRVSVWTNAMVRKAINEDTKPDGSFGAARVSIMEF